RTVYHCDPDALARRLTARQFREWQDAYELEPWGETRVDLAAAIVAAAIYNVHRKKGAKSVNPIDLMPRWAAAPRKARKKETDKERHDRILNYLIGFTKMCGGEVEFTRGPYGDMIP